MFTASIINPEKRKTKLNCSSCGISYSARDYELLYESKKIVYFKYKNKVYCHECMWKLIRDAANGKKMCFILESDDVEFKCWYDPHDDHNEDETPFSDLF